jgi:uncharacterized membrane protein YphA (DoxX/SURF4 family)
MDTALWIVQVLLALAFVLAGGSKLFMPYEQVVKQQPWAEDFQPRTVRLIGLLELLGGIGVILPALTHILPQLTWLAAVGLVLTMIGATRVNLRRHAYPNATTTLVLLALAAFVVYGRLVALPIS